MKMIATVFALLLSATAEGSNEISAIKLHRHSANHHAWSTNAYFLESASGVVLIDAQLLASDAKTLAAMIKSTGKPLLGVFITHPHLDHYGGLPELKAQLGEFPVYASKDTADHMKEVHEQMLGFFKVPNRFGEALDSRVSAATNIFTNGKTLSLAGIEFTIHDLGPGEAKNNIIIYQKDLNLVFAGDIFYPHTHYYLGEGRIAGARGHLEFILKNYDPETAILGGHTNPARAKQATEQIAYIDFVEMLTAEAMATNENLTDEGNLTSDARSSVIAKVIEHYPHYGDFFYRPEQFLQGNIYGTENYLKQKAAKGK